MKAQGRTVTGHSYGPHPATDHHATPSPADVDLTYRNCKWAVTNILESLRFHVFPSAPSLLQCLSNPPSKSGTDQARKKFTLFFIFIPAVARNCPGACMVINAKKSHKPYLLRVKHPEPPKRKFLEGLRQDGMQKLVVQRLHLKLLLQKVNFTGA